MKFRLVGETLLQGYAPGNSGSLSNVPAIYGSNIPVVVPFR